MSAIWFWEAQTRLMVAKRRLALTLSVLVLFAPGALYSQQSETTVSLDARKMQELLNRIGELETSQKQLRERVAQLEQAQSASHAVPAGSAAAARDSSPAPGSLVVAESSPNAESAKADPPATPQADQAGSTEEQEHMDVSRTALNIRGFGDFGFYGGNQKGQTSSFSLGQTNLFITSLLHRTFQNGFGS